MQNRSGKINMIIAAIVGVAVVGGAGALAYVKFKPGISSDPAQVIAQSTANLKNVKTFDFSGNVSIDATTTGDASSMMGPLSGLPLGLGDAATTGKPEKANLQLGFSGSGDVNDVANPKFSVKTTIDAKSDSSQNNFSGGLEAIVLSKVLYGKLTGTPSGKIDLSAIFNKWIKIDTEALKKEFGGDTNTNTPATVSSDTMTKEQISQLQAAFQSDNVVKLSTVGDESLDGQAMTHFKYSVNKDGLKKFVLDMDKITGKASVSPSDLDDSLAAVDFTDGDIWIGKSDVLPHKISGAMTIKETAKSKSSGQITFSLSANNYGKPVTIEAPADSVGIEDVFGAMMGGMMGGSLGGDTNANINAGTGANGSVNGGLNLNIPNLPKIPNLPNMNINGNVGLNLNAGINIPSLH